MRGTEMDTCAICGMPMRQIEWTHLRSRHGMTTDEYKKIYWRQVALEQFEQSVIRGPGCWICTSSPSKSGGYGRISVLRKTWRAHILSYLLFRGVVESGLEVCHKCDNPMCVNPDHLFLGTHEDNMHDMFLKGRRKAATGERNHSKLTEAQVLEMRERYSRGEKVSSLSRGFGISYTTASNIVLEKKWKYLEDKK